MSLSQRIILSAGLLVVAAFCLRPPYLMEHTTYLVNRESNVPHKAGTGTNNVGHRWIWNPPEGNTRYGLNAYGRTMESRIARVDLTRLGVYVGLTAAISLFLAFVVFRRQKR